MAEKAAKKEALKERTWRGKIEKAKQGYYTGGRLPTGISSTPDKTFVLNHQRELVRHIFDLALENMPYPSIANRLMDEGIPTPTGNKNWCTATVERMTGRQACSSDIRWLAALVCITRPW